MSLRARFTALLGLVLALAFVVNEGMAYRAAMHDAQQSLLEQAERVRAVLMATRRVYHEQFLSSGLPLTPATVGFLPAHAMNRISQEITAWDVSGFSFNNVSDRPRNPTQAADVRELDVMGFFAARPEAELFFEPFVGADGQRYYQYARPIRIEAYCLKCHGDEADAPETIRELYDGAYGYQVGDLRGLLSIRLPARAVDDRAHAQLWSGFVGHALTFLLLFALSRVLVRRYVDQPLAAAVGNLERIARSEASGDVHPVAGEAFASLIGAISDLTQQVAEKDAAQQEALAALRQEQAVTQRSAAELREYGARQRELLREVNHRVRNNLGALLGMLHHELDAIGPTAPAAEPLLQMERRVQALAAVQDLLSASQGGPLRLVELCERVTTTALRGLCGETCAAHVLDAPAVVPGAVAHNVALILVELVTNSAKHGRSADGLLHITVAVAEEPEAAWVRVIYKDAGPGYPDAVLRGDGLGTGLALLHGLVAHSFGSALELANDPGATATFRVPTVGLTEGPTAERRD